jgi:hypothetical protein
MRQESLLSRVSSTAFVFVGAAVAVLVVLQWFGWTWNATEDVQIAAGVIAALSGRAAWLALTRSMDEFGPVINGWLAACKFGGIVVVVGYTASWSLRPVIG